MLCRKSVCSLRTLRRTRFILLLILILLIMVWTSSIFSLDTFYLSYMMITFMSEECLQWQFWWWQCWLLFGDGGHNGDGVDVDTDPDHVQGVDLRGCFFPLQTWLAGCSLHTAQVSWLWWLRSLADDALFILLRWRWWSKLWVKLWPSYLHTHWSNGILIITNNF